MPQIRLLPLCALAVAIAAPALCQDRLLHLDIGDAARRAKDVPVILDAVTDARDGALLTPDEVASRLAGVRMLLVGEEHTSMEFHRAQARILQALVKTGRPVLIGLEMYPYTQQAHLDAWSAGRLTEDQFIDQSRWYENWGYHWLYYRDIFLFARDNKVPMYAVNTPREVVAAVRKKGLANLTPEEARHIPKDIDLDNPDHMTFFKATFEGVEGPVHGAGMGDDMWKNMLSAQATWDATMGFNAVEALRRDGRKDALMVVLVGSGHVVYNVGIARQATRWIDGPIASLVPVAVTRATGGTPVKEVRASYADFIWGVPGELDSLYPTLGISMAVGEAEAGRTVLMVQPGTAAAAAGFLARDVLLTLDGAPIASKEAYNRLLAAKRWGDSATFTVRRGTETMTLRPIFRRTVPAQKQVR